MTDPKVLTHWFDAAMDQPTLEAFRAVVEGSGTPPVSNT